MNTLDIVFFPGKKRVGYKVPFQTSCSWEMHIFNQGTHVLHKHLPNIVFQLGKLVSWMLRRHSIHSSCSDNTSLPYPNKFSCAEKSEPITPKTLTFIQFLHLTDSAASNLTSDSISQPHISYYWVLKVNWCTRTFSVLPIRGLNLCSTFSGTLLAPLLAKPTGPSPSFFHCLDSNWALPPWTLSFCTVFIQN